MTPFALNNDVFLSPFHKQRCFSCFCYFPKTHQVRIFLDLGDRNPFINKKKLVKWQIHQSFKSVEWPSLPNFPNLHTYQSGFCWVHHQSWAPPDSCSPSIQFFLVSGSCCPSGSHPSVLGSWYTVCSFSPCLLLLPARASWPGIGCFKLLLWEQMKIGHVELCRNLPSGCGGKCL